MPSGAKSYCAVAKDPRGKQVWTTIGKTADISLDAARERARAILAAVRAGSDASGPETFQAVAEQWLARHVEKKGLRTADRTRWQLKKYLLPTLGGRDFASIRRGEIARLLDGIEDKSGARTADLVLSTISGLVTFYAQRHEDYVSPLVKGMRRYDKAANARSRILSDDEIRDLMGGGQTLDVAKLALLTAQRIDKVRTMRWEDVSVDGTWTIPAEAREKVNAGELVLPEAALEIIKRQPRFASNRYVFAGRYAGEPRSYNNIDQAIKKLGVEWKLHDLRRTAKSLMQRAGTLPHISERVLGHVIGGVEGVYDRHSYREEKAHALKALASLIENILAPTEAKVRRLRG
jgi:integrase